MAFVEYENPLKKIFEDIWVKTRQATQVALEEMSESLKVQRSQVAIKGHKKKVFHKKPRPKTKPSALIRVLVGTSK